ncbi:ATP-binding protein [Rhizorhapis sp. SPR117]|uniref:ATP-binding protein n=1 Tax=Rhizorhapis sp. SPR117 TaxID=2912611 RepID=UPI001F2CF260|nr:ATP-binding protein [Rhizorhapis sp. SPR117]
MYWFKFLKGKKPGRDHDFVEVIPDDAVSPFRASSHLRHKRISHLPRFRGSARDQLHESGGGQFAGMRQKFRHAFTPSQPVIHKDRFAGRADALGKLIRGIEDQRLHPILYGDRGIGKTSLLHILADTAREAGYAVLYHSCDADTHFDEMFRSVLAQIPQLYHGGVTPTHDPVETGASLLDMAPPTATLSPRHVTDLLASVVGIRVIVLLDEFDRATSSQFRRSVAELIKNLSDRSARVQLVVAGVAANFTELIEHIPSIRRNILNLELPRMTDAEIDEMMQIGAQASGLGFDETACMHIRTIADGSPYIAALLAHHAGLAAIEEEVAMVSPGHVAIAIEAASDELGSHIRKRNLAQV